MRYLSVFFREIEFFLVCDLGYRPDSSVIYTLLSSVFDSLNGLIKYD